MSKTIKISKVVIALFAIMLILTNTYIVFGESYDDKNAGTYTPQEFTKNKDGKTEGGEIKVDADGAKKVKTIGGKIVGIIRVVGTMVAVGMLTVMGIKYMMGSAEERAEYKKTMFPYLVGAVLIFAATSLAQVIYEWASAI